MALSGLPWDLDFITAEIPEGLEFEASYDPATGRVESELRNAGGAVAHPRQVTLRAEMGSPCASGRAWLMGDVRGGGTRVQVFGEGPDTPAGTRTYASAEVLVLELPVKATPMLLIGSLRMDQVRTRFEATFDGEETEVESLSITLDLDGLELAAGGQLALPPILVLSGRDAPSLFEAYADEAGEEMGARVSAQQPAGFAVRLGADATSPAAELADALACLAEYSAADFFVVVDARGRADLDHGALATQIRQAGFQPGLRLAPFAVGLESELARLHPETLLRDAHGVPVPDGQADGRYVLDCTTPAARDYVRSIAAAAVDDYGYKLLLLDGIAALAHTASAVSYHHATTANGHIRLALEALREAAGATALLADSGGWSGAGIGLLDAVVPGTGTEDLLLSGWMHGRWWLNSAGVLPVAAPTEAPGARAALAGAAVSGGSIFFDVTGNGGVPPPSSVATFLPPTGVAAAAADADEGPTPSAWRADLGEARSLLAIFNWAAKPRWVVTGELLRPGEAAFSCFDGRLLGMGDVLLAPGEAVLWQVTGPGKTPRAVGDSASATYAGLFERQVSGRLQLRNDLARARTVAVEARGGRFEVTLAPGEMRWFD